jgi:hypothetical protein
MEELLESYLALAILFDVVQANAFFQFYFWDVEFLLDEALFILV